MSYVILFHHKFIIFSHQFTDLENYKLTSFDTDSFGKKGEKILKWKLLILEVFSFLLRSDVYGEDLIRLASIITFKISYWPNSIFEIL